MIQHVSFFLFVLATSIFETQALPPDANVTVSDFCLQVTELTQEFVDSFIGDSPKEPTEEYYCYLQCVFTAIGLLDEDGVVNVDLMLRLYKIDEDCIRGMPKIVECTDMEAFEKCVSDS